MDINGRPPVLSLYLEAGPVRDQKFHAALLTDLAKRQDGETKGPLDPFVHRELGRVRSYLELHPHDGQALAIFSGLSAGVFDVRRLAENVRTEMWLDDHPHLEPLVAMLKAHPETVIVAADKQRGRIFTDVLGEIHLVAEIAGRPIKRHRQGGIHRAPYQRRIDVHTDQNLAAVAESVDRLVDGSVRSIYLAGPPEAISSLLHHLAPRLQRMIVGELHVPLYEDTPQLQEELRGALRRLAA